MKTPDFILAGYERGGTTLLSEIFRSNGFESGFECGVLMVSSPKDMPNLQPYWDMILPGWKVDEEVRDDAVSADFQYFYDRLFSAAFPDFNGRFFDKTPIYMSQLGLCMSRAPDLRGAVVIHRDPRAVFLSQAKRAHPNLSLEDAVNQDFELLTRKYLNYFTGSIAHLDNPDVLFVPFEELVSRENTWLKNIGNFASGQPFQKMHGQPRFNNVTSPQIDFSKLMEFENVLSTELQTRILEATKIASPFFANASDRARFGQFWQDTLGRANEILAKNGLPRSLILEDGTYFEPLTYLLKYEDVRNAGINPVAHYLRHGRFEQRN